MNYHNYYQWEQISVNDLRMYMYLQRKLQATLALHSKKIFIKIL